MLQSNLSANIQTPLWQGFAGSSIGKAHIDANLPNQDSFFIQQTDSIMVAVVCDGAGSAQFSQEGSHYFANEIGNFLIDFSASLDLNFKFHSQDWLNYAIIQTELTYIRQRLIEKIPSTNNLKNYHSTVTAVLLIKPLNQVVFIRIGDSPILTSQFIKNQQGIDYFANLQSYADDSKNEYVNETHFITQDNWQEFLRIEWLDTTNIDLIALMSDGCADLVVEGAKRPMTIYRPFFGNLIFNLCTVTDTHQGNQVIAEALANPATYRLTGDDKTLAVLIKHSANYRGVEPLMAAVASTSTMESGKPDSVWHQSAPNAAINTANLPSSPIQGLETTSQLPYSDNHVGKKTEITTQASLAPNNPTATLPPTPTISSAGKQRRNTAIAAGLAALAGAGTLFWLNQDKLPAKTSDTVDTVAAASVSGSQPQVSSNAMLPLALDEAAQIAINHPTTSFDVILAMPTDNQNQALVDVTAKNGNLSVSQTSLSIASTVSSATAGTSTATSAKTIPATITCQPIANDKLTALASIGVAVDKAWQYQHCQVTLPSDKTVQGVNQLTLPNGLSELINVTAKSNSSQAIAIASQVAASAVPTGDAAQIQLYYLPTAFATLTSSNVASQVASTVAVTAS